MNNQTEILKLIKKVGTLEDLVKLLMGQRSINQSQIAQLSAYMSMLQRDFGLNVSNRDMFRKLVYNNIKLKDYFTSNVILSTLNHKLQHFTFNLEQGTSYYELNSLYNLNTQNKSFYFEFNLIVDYNQLFSFSSKQNDILDISVTKTDIRMYTLNRLNNLVDTIIIINNDKFKEILTNEHSFNYVPVIFEFDASEYKLYIYQAIIFNEKIDYKRKLLLTITNTNDFMILKDVICYVGMKNTLPDAYKINVEGAFRLRVKNAMMMISEEERELPYAGYTGLSGLQGYSYLKDLSSHLIESRSYSYTQQFQSTIADLGPIHVSQKIVPHMISPSNNVFTTNDLIIAGVHDNNDRVYDANRSQSVYIFPTSMVRPALLAYDEEESVSTMITIEGNDYFDVPIIIKKVDDESKTEVEITGFVRFTQSLNAIELLNITGVANGKFKNVSYISCASLDYKESKVLDDGTVDITYTGNQFGLGFGSLLHDNVDSYIVFGTGSFIVSGRVYINESHALSIEPTKGEFEIEFNGTTQTISTTFELRKENEHGLVNTYLASRDVFDLNIKRFIGIQVQSNDSNDKDELVITKADDNGKVIVPYDNKQDMMLYTPRENDMAIAREWAQYIFFTDHMKFKIDNINCIETIDNFIFEHRELPNRLLLEPKIEAGAFGWNGMMAPNLKNNAWSRTGYLDKIPITMQTNLEWDGWNMLNGKFPTVKEQPRNNPNFDSKKFLVVKDTATPHIIYLHNLENWNYQPTTPFNFTLLELTIKNVIEVSSEAIDNVFDTNVDLSKIQTEIELIFRTQKDIINHIADMDYKIDKIVGVIDKIGKVLDNLIKSLQQMEHHNGSSFIQDLFNVGVFLLEMIAPELVLFIAPFALLLVGTASLVTGDIQGGIIDLIGGAVIAAYFHVPNYIIPYGKKLINKFTSFNSISHNFLNYTKRIGNSLRRYVPSLRGFYDVRYSKLRLQDDQYTYTMDNYNQRYELIELNFIAANTKKQLHDTDVKIVKDMTFHISRIFRIINPKNQEKLNTIIGEIVLKFTSAQNKVNTSSKLKLKRKLELKSIINTGNDNIVEITFNLKYRSHLNTSGLFQYIDLDENNYKDYINTDMTFKFMSESMMIAMLYDAKTSINHMSAEVSDYLDGLLEITIDHGKLRNDYHIVGLINPHVNYTNLKSSSDILYSILGILGKNYPFHSGTD